MSDLAAILGQLYSRHLLYVGYHLTEEDEARLVEAGWARSLRVGGRPAVAITASGREALQVGMVGERHARRTSPRG